MFGIMTCAHLEINEVSITVCRLLLKKLCPIILE
jgi:hypothetical protein